MTDDDDRHWMDALAGRPASADAQVTTLKEGAVVRQAMLASQRPAPRFDADTGARRLLTRLREEKLLEGPPGGRFGWKLPALGVVVAVAVALGLAIRERPPVPPAAPDVQVMTGDPEAAQSIVTPDAREIADEVRGMMAKAGLSPVVTEIGSLTRLEVDWPRSPSEEQLDFLRLYGLGRPAGARLKVEIRLPKQ